MANTLKGKVFEYFLKQLLEGCGFTPVLSDGMIVYDGSAGQMIHGLGQAHNADVLMAPPMQTPFYYNTNLLVECKCYSEPLGLPFVRNVLGLREDINKFDIITPDILNARKNYHGKTPKLFPFNRYTYQVALASISGFTRPAIEFAQVHRIPLISFAEGELFAPLREAIDSIDSSNFSELDWTDILNGNYNDIDEIEYFFDYTEDLKERVRIGLLENGTILFLCQYYNNKEAYYSDNSFTLHWENRTNNWTLKNNDLEYHFELPKEMMMEWEMQTRNSENDFYRKMSALNLKEKYFPKVYLFDTDTACIRVLKINKDFLYNAYNNIFNEFI